MGGSSKSSTSSSTTNKTANAANETGIQLVESNGNTIVSTDYDAVKLSFDAINSVTGDAFEFADEASERSFDFADEALQSVGDANERIESISSKTVDTLQDFATTLKTGDLKTTQTIYLAGAGIAGVVLLCLLYTSPSPRDRG